MPGHCKRRRSQAEVVVDGQRCVIGEALRQVDVLLARRGGDGRPGQVVVETTKDLHCGRA